MEPRDMYSVQELYEGLEISMLELSRRSNINPGTLLRIKKGYSARRPTVNKLLRTFSEIYHIPLSLNNVLGIHLEGEEVKASEKAEKPSILPPVVQPTRIVPEKVPKRDYKPRDAELPEGCVLASAFAESHGVNRKTFEGHYKTGLGRKGKEKAVVSARPKPGRENRETEYYLIPEQQVAVLRFWSKYDVSFSQCDRIDCLCKED